MPENFTPVSPHLQRYHPEHYALGAVREQRVMVSESGLSGIFDKTGKVPFNGDQMCFEGCTKK